MRHLALEKEKAKGRDSRIWCPVPRHRNKREKRFQRSNHDFRLDGGGGGEGKGEEKNT